MGLQGRLEDLALLDMIQVIAFSQKTGCLRIESPHGNGLLAFRSGRLLFCSSWSTVSQFSRLQEGAVEDRKATLKNLCVSSMRDLAGLTQGNFVFDVSDNFDVPFEGLSVSDLLMETGLDPQNLLLKLSKEIDEARRDASEKLGLFDDWSGPDLDDAFSNFVSGESSGESGEREMAPSGPVEAASELTPSGVTVVVVDDEPAVVSTVGMGLRSDGFRVKEATTPAEGKRAVDAVEQSGDIAVLVVDLKMPTSDGLSFLGGLELVSALKDGGKDVPTLLMVENLTVEEKQVALALGLRKVIYKPTLTKTDPQLYAEDLNLLASGVGGQVELMMNALGRRLETPEEATPVPVSVASAIPIPSAPPVKPLGDESAGQPPSSEPKQGQKSQNVNAFLAEALQRLETPTSSKEVYKMVLEVASRYLERGILMLVRGDSAYGIAGFRLRHWKGTADVKSIRVAAKDNESLRQAITTRGAQRVGEQIATFDKDVFSKVGRGNVNQCVLLPIVVNGQVLTILYGDNGIRGKPIGTLKALQTFVQQASFSMQAALLVEKSGK